MVRGPFALHVGVPLGAGGLGSIERALGCEPGWSGRLVVQMVEGEATSEVALSTYFDAGSWQVWGEPDEIGVGAAAHLVVEFGDEPSVALVGAVWQACSRLVGTAGPADGLMVLSTTYEWEDEVGSFVQSACLGVDPVRFPSPNAMRREGERS